MLRPVVELRDLNTQCPNKVDVPIPDLLLDKVSNKTYNKRRFFGKGGFAKCYEIIDNLTSESFAGKIVPKRLLRKGNLKAKLVQEIQIHKSLRHKNIVGFHGFFDDDNFVYIVLELCGKRSMMELSRRRKTLTEPEVRYFLKQILEGVSFLHDNRIVHRDLKLGNIFINDDIQIKIGDFGLATKIEFSGQRKTTLCGTPNYIAPEILLKQGHSFAVDVWSIGCIMYTLLVGKPPFESENLKEIYSKIKRCEFVLPPDIARLPSGALIKQLLQSQPEKRPSVSQILQDNFMLEGFLPSQLPASCLTMAPRSNTLFQQRTPLSELVDNNQQELVYARLPIGEQRKCATDVKLPDCLLLLKSLNQQLSSLFPIPSRVYSFQEMEDLTDPVIQPLVWVSKWTDYCDKYGFGYQLCDDTMGVVFNDSTRLILLPNQTDLHFITKTGEEHYHTLTNPPENLAKKIKLLTYFRKYMTNNLLKTGEAPRRDPERLSRMPYLQSWCRSRSAVLMLLSNGTLQTNFTDHTKVILCPVMVAVSYIDPEQHFFTFKLSTVSRYISHPRFARLAEALYYVHKKIPCLR